APFYYSPLDMPTGCAEVPAIGPCLPVILGRQLNFYDSPRSGCFPGGKSEHDLSKCGGTMPPYYFSFTTQLVGILSCTPSSLGCKSEGFKPSAPLFEWTWKSDYSGEDGGVYDVGVISETAGAYAPIPGNGKGGITITGINGVMYKKVRGQVVSQ